MKREAMYKGLSVNCSHIASLKSYVPAMDGIYIEAPDG